MKVLLKTDHPKNNPKIAWVTQYGKSRVFYLMLGHDVEAYACPQYPKLRASRDSLGCGPVMGVRSRYPLA